MVIGSSSVSQERIERKRLLILFHQNIFIRKILERPWERYSRSATCKVLLKRPEVRSFYAQIELLVHHLTKYCNFLFQAQPFDSWDDIQAGSEERHDSQIPPNRCFRTRMQDLDSDSGGG